MRPSSRSLFFLLLAVVLQSATSFSVETGRRRGSSGTGGRRFAAPGRRARPSHGCSTLMDTESSVATTHETKTTGRPDGEPTANLESVFRPGITADTGVWKHLCPSVLEDARGADVRLHWKKPVAESTSQLAEQVALSMLSQLVGESSTPCSFSETKQMQSLLQTSLETFMSFCENELKSDVLVGYTARVVATRGAASTKCPAWHQDHVPLRWIQSLVGPGCQWVDDASLLADWDAAAAAEEESESEDSAAMVEESVDDLNRRRVNPNVPIRQASPGEAVLLIGRSWSEYCRHAENRDLPAVIHKSPSGLLPWQGRVLLTIDVLTEEEE